MTRTVSMLSMQRLSRINTAPKKIAKPRLDGAPPLPGGGPARGQTSAMFLTRLTPSNPLCLPVKEGEKPQ